jgi:putative hydrolase of the HAD superfamily
VLSVPDRSVDAVAFDDYGVLTGGPPGGDLLLDVVRRLRSAGLRTALVSNAGDRAAEERDALFDVVLLSGATGMAKPDPRVFALCAARLALPPARCAVVDDVQANVRGAVAAGLVGICHRTLDGTLAELEALTGLPLRA